MDDDAHYLSWCCQPQASASNGFVKYPLIFVLLISLQDQQPAGQLTVGVRQAPPVRVREPQAGTDHGADAASQAHKKGESKQSCGIWGRTVQDLVLNQKYS